MNTSPSLAYAALGFLMVITPCRALVGSDGPSSLIQSSTGPEALIDRSGPPVERPGAVTEPARETPESGEGPVATPPLHAAPSDAISATAPGRSGRATAANGAMLIAMLSAIAIVCLKMAGHSGTTATLAPRPRSAAAIAAPRPGIVVAERNDYPSGPNESFMSGLVAKGLLTATERMSMGRQFHENAFAALLHLAQRMPQHKEALGRLWADSIGVAYVDPFKTAGRTPVALPLNDTFLSAHPVAAIHEIGGVLTLATYTPNNSPLMTEIENLTGKFISPVFSFPDQILACNEIQRATADTLADRMSTLRASTSLLGEATGVAAPRDEATSVTDFVRDLMLLALRERASDIHIEPAEDHVRIRFRIDGMLREVMKLNRAHLPALISVLKLRAGADIAETRKPQDGHLVLDLAGRSLDFRFSSVPSTLGEKVVLRLLGQSQMSAIPDIEELGCSKSVLEGMKRIIHSPNGVFFITGPTGSGKTTTLYSALKCINKGGINIMTVEDPVEYHLPGICQVQVNTQAGVTFAGTLRAFLRQDPDVILVGEIRDLETAKIAAQAALTGHLVLTTMHTNNALQAVTRLIQIGVEPFLVAPSIIGVMAQRLVRRLCDHCKQPRELTPGERDALFVSDADVPVQVYEAKACPECAYTGFNGRIAIHELFVIDEDVRNLIAHDATILDIKKAADERGFTTMHHDGIKKVLRGLTTLAEVNQVTTDAE